MEKKDDFGFRALFLEVTVVMLILMVMFDKLNKKIDKLNPITPTVTMTPTMTPSPTNTPTVTPSPTMTPSPEPTVTPSPSPTLEAVKGQSSFKTYMSYKAITLKTSPQWALQIEAYTGDFGIRMVGDRYCVALGSYWAREIGTKLDVYMDTGEVIKVILGDCKQDIHTDKSNKFGSRNGDVLEFIVDPDAMPSEVKNCGNYGVIFGGKVVRMERVE